LVPAGVAVAPASLSLRLPKHTVSPPKKSRMRDAKVSQKPGPVRVWEPAPGSLRTSWPRRAKSAISIRNAIKVRVAARKASKEEISVRVIWVETENRRARRVTAVATGCTASPRVQVPLIVTPWVWLLVLTLTGTVYPYPDFRHVRASLLL